MPRGSKEIITLDILNEYMDILNERMRRALTENRHPIRIYIGDCVQYALQLYTNNGWNPERDSDEIFGTLQAIFCLCFQANGIDGIAEYDDDLEHLVVS